MATTFIPTHAGGHVFDHDGICRQIVSGTGLVCNRDWLDIQYTTTADIDAEGIAHYGKLTGSEAVSIMNRKKAMDDRWAEILGSPPPKREKEHENSQEDAGCG